VKLIRQTNDLKIANRAQHDLSTSLAHSVNHVQFLIVSSASQYHLSKVLLKNNLHHYFGYLWRIRIKAWSITTRSKSYRQSEFGKHGLPVIKSSNSVSVHRTQRPIYHAVGSLVRKVTAIQRDECKSLRDRLFCWRLFNDQLIFSGHPVYGHNLSALNRCPIGIGWISQNCRRV
jgi:hypothetical protein